MRPFILPHMTSSQPTPRSQVSVMEMGSHELFRFAGEASGVVVTVEGQGPEAWLPEPHQLAGVLRGQSAWEDAL